MRRPELVAALLDQFEQAVGSPVEVRYASSSELAAQLLEEGAGTEADLFFSQDAGALGALAKAGMLETLDESVVADVPAEFRDAENRWVATSPGPACSRTTRHRFPRSSPAPRTGLPGRGE